MAFGIEVRDPFPAKGAGIRKREVEERPARSSLPPNKGTVADEDRVAGRLAILNGKQFERRE